MAENYKQVIFDRTSRTYPTDAHVECSYVIKSTYSPTKNDWIGLFKVGWSSVKDFVSYEWAPYPTDITGSTDCQGSLLFQASNLPREDGEFYQFVYFDSKGHMRGASSPFTFRAPNCDELVEEVMADDSDMLFITTRQMQLEGQIKLLQAENSRLEQSTRALDTDRCHLIEKLADTEKKLRYEKAEQERLVSRLKENDELTEKMKLECETLNERATKHELLCAKLNEELDSVLADKKHLQTLVQGNVDTIAKMRDELDVKAGELRALSEEKKLYVEHASDAENVKRDHEKQLSEKKAELAAMLVTHASDVDVLGDKITKLNDVVKSQEEQLAAAEERHHADVKELQTLEETLDSLSSKIEAVNMENSQLKQMRDTDQQRLKELRDEKMDWDQTLAQNSKEVNHLLSTIESLKKKLAEVSDYTADSQLMQEDRYFALQTAYGLLKDELRQTMDTLDKKIKQESKLVESERSANRQVYELKEKLKLGEIEWKKVTDKNLELQKKLSKALAKKSSFSLFGDLSKWKELVGSSGTSQDLSRDELLKMVEQLSCELEVRTQKKDRYKTKYLEEKQRAVTLRDYYKGEIERYSRELELARSALDLQVSQPATKGSTAGSLAHSFSYPPVPSGNADIPAMGAAGPIVYPGLTTGTSKSDSTESDNHPLLISLPTPSSPTKTVERCRSEDVDSLDLDVSYSNKDTGDAADSDDDNELAERFHDAVDIPSTDAPPESCCVCHIKFDDSETVQHRSAHVNDHYESAAATAAAAEAANLCETHYSCPMCDVLMEKSQHNEQQFEEHVNSHFSDP